MKTIGETIKEIRIGKNLTREDLASDTVSLSTIKRIENDAINTSFINLQSILHTLNIDFEEFNFIRNNYNLMDNEQLTYDFRKLTSVSVDSKEIEKLVPRYERYLENHDDLEIANRLAFLKALIVLNQTNDLEKAASYVSHIWDNLEQLDNWYWADIQILSNIFFTFPIDTAQFIVELLLDKLDNYKTFKNADRLYIALRINYLQVLMLNHQFEKAYASIDATIELAKEKKFFLQWANAIGKKGILLHRLEMPGGEEYIAKAKRIWETLDEPKYIEDLDHDIELFLSKSQ
ncbi:putative transcriptional activator [Listeria floridensis FSL S10-1187]|uniref:Transcriptional activator n=1 Tax=Listeria floridensis FSL S10-1187 TaxID=1265817 RepID=A0ABP3AWR1_9LIST|nr:Rgg/GadR/MutR family transcriptional regulator [Listeria floridensis]EUJ30321.1 putative transcriptional activator [Listeria floridensis FSL S10-1187]